MKADSCPGEPPHLRQLPADDAAATAAARHADGVVRGDAGPCLTPVAAAALEGHADGGSALDVALDGLAEAAGPAAAAELAVRVDADAGLLLQLYDAQDVLVLNRAQGLLGDAAGAVGVPRVPRVLDLLGPQEAAHVVCPKLCCHLCPLLQCCDAADTRRHRADVSGLYCYSTNGFTEAALQALLQCSGWSRRSHLYAACSCSRTGHPQSVMLCRGPD